MKQILLSILLLIVLVGVILIYLNDAMSFEWGHYFDFKNELGIEIDSLEISVGEVKTMVRSGGDRSKDLGGNIDVPDDDYPHLVTIKIFNNQEVLTLKADSFNCYNCDGTHQYILNNSRAEYHFFN